MDTIANAIKTVQTVADTISNSQVIEIYKTMMQNQETTHHLYIWILLGIVTALFAVTWFWNFKLAKKQIKYEIKEGLDAYDKTQEAKFENYKKEQETKLQESIKNIIESKEKKTERKFLVLEAEKDRAFSLLCSSNQKHPQAIMWGLVALDKYIKLQGDDDIIRIGVKRMRSILERVDEWKNKINDEFDFDMCISIAEKIPALLNDEKKIIIKKLKELKQFKEQKPTVAVSIDGENKNK